MGTVVFGVDFRRHMDCRKPAKSDAQAIIRGLGFDADTAPCEYVLDGGEMAQYVAPEKDPA